ncbi:MAG: hypothetical protein ACI8P9_002801 [Parasphingorhabdus sp.]|jgi:hypothetical protein
MKLAEVFPWGRSLSDYEAMFALTSDDLNKRILGCSDGPASFNAQLSSEGGSVLSVDPIYQFSKEQINARIDEAFPQIIQQLTTNQHSYVWNQHGNIESLSRDRMDSMRLFLEDYEPGRLVGRYCPGSLPDLPFMPKQFELALCSHFLFLYSELIDLEQHILAMQELCRVAEEVRVYPLLSLDCSVSNHLHPTISQLAQAGIEVDILPVGYEFQKGATQMLVARAE